MTKSKAKEARIPTFLFLAGEQPEHLGLMEETEQTYTYLDKYGITGSLSSDRKVRKYLLF